MMVYKGYLGKAEFDDAAEVFHGEVVNIRDVVTFQGKSVAELRRAFRESIEDYLDFCQSRGETPDKPFSGRFVTRVPPELHRQLSSAAARAKKSLNAWVTEQLQAAAQLGAEAPALSRTVPVPQPGRIKASSRRKTNPEVPQVTSRPTKSVKRRA